MPKPFGKIALSLSGGGVRSVGFHTGVLAYLDRLEYLENPADLNHAQVLEDVSMLSAVSGGSLVALGYAAHLSSPGLGQTFKHFHDGIREDFDTKYYFVEHLLQQLNTQYPPSPAGRRYLIAAYADLLNNSFRFFDNRAFDLFFQNVPNDHIEELIINSLECYFGEGFRFQQGSLSGLSGNYRIELQDQFARETLLSDIMAASSDLPGAFAPTVFPDDFHWPDDVYPEPYANPRPMCENIQNAINAQFPGNGGKSDTQKITLIDGGIHDNQGISAIVNWLHTSTDFLSASNAFRRLFRWEALDDDAPPRQIERSRRRTLEDLGAATKRCSTRRSYWDRYVSRRGEGDRTIPQPLPEMSPIESETQIGLFIVSDAPEFRGPDPIYEVSKEWWDKWKISLRTVVWVSLLGLILGALALAYVLIRLIFGPPFLASPTLWDIVVLVILLVVLAVVVIVTGVLLWRFFKALRTCDNTTGSMWHYIRRVKIRDLRNMLWLRAGSVAAVMINIMPNRIRNQGIDLLLSDPLIHEDTVVINEIDDFMKPAATGLPPWMSPSPEIVDVSTEVATMETRFWLTIDEFDKLVASGQCTTCYNLLVQLWLRSNLYPRVGTVFNNPLHQQVFDQCEADWQALKLNPLALLP